MNPEIWDDASTNAISKEVILALLQCAARLYEGGVHTKEAVDLIESEDTRAILSLGIQDSLSQVIHQRCVESIRSNKSEATSAENCSQQAGLFSAMRKNKARQLNHQAMIIEHISSLCHSHSAALQNTFDSPMIDEQFMFTNYITLSKTLNLCEKSWLVTLLPDIFQWENQDACGDVKLLNNEFLAANLAIVPNAIKEVNQDPCTNASKAITSPQDAITPCVIQGAKQNADTSCDSPACLDLVDYLPCSNALDNKLVLLPSHDLVIISNEL